MLYEFSQAVPGIEVAGIDISQYAIENAKTEMRSFLRQGTCRDLPYGDKSFDFVFSINTFHNLYVDELDAALNEMERVGKGRKYVCVESYRDEREKANLLYWQLTCESFYTPREWEWVFARAGYTGDHGFIFFR